ncbi:MAG: flavin monoamine oxidase family protein, partial [Candidatus Acidiferrum sp.]
MRHALFNLLHEKYGNPPDCRMRRQMLRDTLAATAGLLLSDGLCFPARAERTASPGKRALVIGAGLAGLAASHELASAGYDVSVVEARNRLGGRVVTFRDLVPGKTVEGGGEFIGSNHPTWLAYAKQFGLKLRDVSKDWLKETPIILGGKRLTANEGRKLWLEMQLALPKLNTEAAKFNANEPWKSSTARELDLQTAADWLAGLAVSDLARLGLLVHFVGDAGVHPAWQSYLSLLAHVKGGGLEKYWTDSEVYRCEGGNQMLARKLAEKIGEKRISLGTPVTAVSEGPKLTVITLANGKKLEVDDVILAAPPSTWQRIAFQPLRPAMGAPQMATHIKFLAVVKSRFWKALKLSPESLT